MTSEECPLCAEPFELDDLNFFPCTCSYQVCRFCWHRIRTDENGLCPACRKPYPERPVLFKPVSETVVRKVKREKRRKRPKTTEPTKNLENVKVIQRDLVFVTNLPPRLADENILKSRDHFGKYGKISNLFVNSQVTQGRTLVSAYVTYHRPEDASKAIKFINETTMDGKRLKASLGATKYCYYFLRNELCCKPNCPCLHKKGDDDLIFTNEELRQGKHMEYLNKKNS